MSKTENGRVADELIAWLDEHLVGFRVERSGLTLRERVLRLVELRSKVQELGIAAVAEGGICERAAQSRMRQYLIAHYGIPIGHAELAVVAGISAFARRIRQLRTEEGYRIVTGKVTDPFAGIEMRRDEYMLIAPEPDLDAARRWHVANRIRRMPGSGPSRMLAFLRENVGRAVTTDELGYVAKEGSAFTRRVRELRTQGGYAIATRFTGRPDLPSGVYVLESLEPVVPPHDRAIPAPTLRAVWDRDGSRCTRCGWEPALATRADPRFLEVHHLTPHEEGGPNELENLAVLCNRCHDVVHADRGDAG